MRLGSLFAGIGGFDLGFERAGYDIAWHVEIDRAASRVLAHHWPKARKYDDITTVKRLPAVDVVVGGFPCQDVSVAGRRAGLAGERSGLWWQFRRILAEHSPRWVIIENVPGLLSSNGGNDMGTILWSLGKLGYGWAYRVLDAQWTGVAQRRRRVFIVGCLGDWTAPAEVLFEPESGIRNIAPRRSPGSDVARPVRASTHSHRGDDSDRITFVADGASTLGAAAYSLTRAPTGQVDHFAIVQPPPALTFNWQADIASLAFTEEATSTLDTSQTKAVFRPDMGVRRLTPLECLRLQEFPDDWLDLDPPLSDSAKYRMIGNAVAVQVAERLALRIMETS